jgi:hypothetical protein
VPVIEECFRGDLGDIVAVDEWLGDAIDGERDLTAEDRVEQEGLAEVLREPAAAQDRPRQRPVLDEPFGGLGLRLTAPGQQDDARDALRRRLLGELRHGLRCARHRNVRRVGDKHVLYPMEHFPPGGGVVPVERRRGGARADPDRHPPVGEAGGDAAADFAGAAEHEYERLLLHVLCHAPSQARRDATENGP